MSTKNHVPWHVRAGLTTDKLAANLAAIRAEGSGTPTEKARTIWEHAYTSAARAGFDAGRVLLTRTEKEGETPRAYVVDPRTVAAVELATAPRRSALADHTGPRKSPPLRSENEGLAEFTDGRIGFVKYQSSEHAAAVGYSDPFEAAQVGDALDTHSAITQARAEIVRQAEMDFLADCTDETGAIVSPEKYEKMQKNRRKLVDMTEKIAVRLKASAIESKRPDAVKAFAYWVHTGHLDELPAYRRICILPSVAASMRAPKLAALEYWLERHEYARFWTFTTGDRCRLEGRDGLENRLKWLSRKLSKLNHALKTYGVEIVFRSVEFGSLEKKTHPASQRIEGGGLEWTEDGSPLFHPHAHCVVVAHFGYNPRRWQEVTQFVRDFWQRKGVRLHCDFGEIIGNARECCKYVTKPGDLLALRDSDLAKLFEITYRAKLCHPMGSLAREIRIREGFTVEIVAEGVTGHARAVADEALDDEAGVPDCEFVGRRQARTLRELAARHRVALADLVAQNPGLPADPDARLDYGTRVVIFPGGKCLRRVRKGRRMVWAERLDQNKTARETESEKREREAREDAFAATAECLRLAALGENHGSQWEDVNDPEFIGPWPMKLTDKALATDARCHVPGRTGCPTRVVARIMPAAGPRRVKEPRVIVMSMDGRRPDLSVVRSHPLVISLWSETVEAFHAGAALETYSVHTGTPTVHEPEWEAPPDPGEAYFEAECAAFNASVAFTDGINF